MTTAFYDAGIVARLRGWANLVPSTWVVTIDMPTSWWKRRARRLRMARKRRKGWA